MLSCSTGALMLVVCAAAHVLLCGVSGLPASTADEAAAEYGEYFQGDIMEPIPGTFAGLLNPANRWPEGVVVYKFDPDLPDPIRQRVLQAMSRVSAETGNCARFREWQPSDGVEFVLIRSGSGCSATVGYWAGRSTSMNLAERCTVGNIMHELQHSLGVEHQQSRPDRDQYVKIQFDNVIPGELPLLRHLQPAVRLRLADALFVVCIQQQRPEHH
ncbi:hypothetical protein BOX15_Mlig002577g2 [Macrostomum lignano]|uniref:Metalloendopeptidase n=1 Tax=Macrostomum lignano TaxID=282301 RepID=A0A267ETV4_9PLAT|nr:hypothetical protein BOX15_Mlig002577g1 [Macrostomum lignano]PAA91996.1 hypothetical protein BOX15_Mlig002577g2 [Macrostomum lignano]